VPDLEAADAFLRIGAAGAAGALIGIERESRNQLAGIRTHALVAAGAAVFTLAGAHGFPEIDRGPNIDPMRVSAQIASGIGFIGAGAIIRDRGSVRGITTAAALWTSAALGLATGAGLWWAALAGSVVTLVILVGLRPVGSRLVVPLTSPMHTIEVEYEKGHGTLGPIMDAVRSVGADLDDLTIHDSAGGATRAVAIDVRVADPDTLAEAVESVGDRPEVRRCTVQRKRDYGAPFADKDSTADG
jgi:putative Mg2+ transporter-C (MgtC) family protein